ncbi:hypothetical protein OC834_006888 [Tilletia horrida]|nr:hypothetical protein OC834_006888 [Tilletia horrida]
MDFGNVIAGNSSQLLLTVTNTGESALTITKSKPPNDQFIHAVNPASDLTEGQVIASNETAPGPVILASQAGQVNTAAVNVSSQWVLNGNDPSFGVTFVQISGRIVSRQVGPRLAKSDPWDKDGTARFGYLGCYTDSPQSRALSTQQSYGSTPAENGACQSISLASGISNFVGTEYANECYAGLQPPPASAKVDDLFCEMPCAGDNTQICGDSGKISIFYDKLAYNATSGQMLPGAFLGPKNKPNVTASNGAVYNYIGCGMDPGGTNRPLKDYSFADGTSMTVEACVNACSSRGLTVAGLEYAQECYCGAFLPAGTATNLQDCTMICKGDRGEYCGAGSRLTLYSRNGTAPPPTTTTTASATATATNPGTTPTSSGFVPSVGAWKYGGCWTDQLPNGRALAALVSAGSSVTAESCVASCQAAGYTIAGTENGNECWCGNGLALGSAKAPDADCSTLCAGNAAEVCGGPFRLTTYSTKTVATASQPATVGNWTFQGCFNDTNTARALQGYANGQTSTNTLESCASICSAFTYFGTEYGSECYCGNTLANGAIAGDASLCNMPCPGDGTELCGAGNQLSVYKNPNPSPPSSTSTAGPTPTQTGTPTASLNIVPSANSLAYQGCWQEPAGGAQRALSTKVAEASNMTVQICTSQCKQAGFKIAGLEYAQECWCGNGIAPGSSKVADAQCSSPCAGNTTTACGGAFLLTSYSATAIIPASQPAKTGNWTFQGCYTDTVTARTLADAAPALGNNNSIQNCAAACSGYTYFGTEYGAECYCGNSILNGGKAVNATQCNLLCSGDGTQICGAGGLLSLYKNSQPGTPTATTTATSTATPTATSSPVIVPTVSGLPYQGCWQEPAGGVPRALATKVAEAANMTVQSCVGSCKSAGYSISGVEYSQECWCGNGISPGSTKIADAQCSNTCAGNSTQFCGGAFLLTTYSAKTIVPAIQPAKTGNWTFQGCYTDTVTARTLADASPALGNNNSIQNCAAACTGYTYFGTEYGAECYCGNSILNGGKAVNATQCNLLCSGDGTQICGAGGLLSLYKNSQPGTPTSTATATSTATPTATKTPVIVPTVSGLPYQGCWQEPAGGVPRALAAKVAEATNMTVQSCVGSCKSAGYSISGVEYSQECWCGNGISPGSTKVADAQCSNTCAGNSTQFCGGAFLLTTYSTKAIVPATQPATVGTYSFKGCYNDTVTARTLGDLTVVGANTTLESCAAACSGYSYFGTEYGAECYCGNKILNGAVATDASKCNMLCGGNGSEICGAGGLLSLYTKLSATSSTTSKVTSSTTTSKATTSTTTSKVTTTSTTAASTTSKATTTTATSATTSKTTSTSSTSSTPTLTVTGLSALGCFVDNSTALSLNVTAYTNTSNSVSNCALSCRNRGFRFSGTEAGTKCFCGNYLQYQAASLGAGQSGCTTACPGDAKQTCGGTNRINIVQDTTWKQKLFTVSRAGKWAFQDCYINNSGARVLNVTLTPTSPITVPNCLDACLAKKLAYCGMGNGQTCYGGAVLASGATKSPSKGSTDPLARGCDMPCTGNSTQACGGSLRLELYRYNSTAASVSPPTLQIASAK